jgi:hypothetical protein
MGPTHTTPTRLRPRGQVTTKDQDGLRQFRGHLRETSSCSSGSAPMSTCSGCPASSCGSADRALRLLSLIDGPSTWRTDSSTRGVIIARPNTSPLSTRLASRCACSSVRNSRPACSPSSSKSCQLRALEQPSSPASPYKQHLQVMQFDVNVITDTACRTATSRRARRRLVPHGQPSRSRSRPLG